jgi:1-acyl-sn-glycerol-3-phosphate acyltransferase
MLPFQLAGTETIRRAARLPVLPVVLDGPWRARTIRDLHRLVGARLRLRILPPIPVEAFDANPRSAYDDLEAKMRRTLDEIRTS